MLHDDHRKFAMCDLEADTDENVSCIAVAPGIPLDIFWALLDPIDPGPRDA